MTKPPTFSVIIPTLNEEKFLPNLLVSLVKQTKKDFETIVVDGKSKDKTVSIARTFQTKLPRLQVIEASRASLPFQRNLGARAARGEWLVFVDADGELLPHFMARCTLFIDTYHPSIFTTWWRPDSETGGDALLALMANMTLEIWFLMNKPHAPGPLTIVSRQAYDTVGGYDEAHSFTEDLDFGIRLGKAGYKTTMLRETLFVWSLRRLRKEGTLKVVQAYVKAAALALFVNRAPKTMHGYIMGGHLYKYRKPVKRSVLKLYERKLKQLMKELFG